MRFYEGYKIGGKGGNYVVCENKNELNIGIDQIYSCLKKNKIASSLKSYLYYSI